MGARASEPRTDRQRALPLSLALLLAAALSVWGLTGGGALPPTQTATAAPPIGDGTGGFRAVKVATAKSPVFVHGPKGARGLVFVVEQAGVIRMIRKGKLLRKPFLDISDRVQSGGEEGLLSVAFSPRYRKDRRFYVYFTNRRGNIAIQEFKRSRRKARKANRRSARRVITIKHPGNSNHNGGQLQFGPDKRLYIGTGDGGGGGDPQENAQNRNSLLGKLLRIDPLKRKRKRGYSIPRNNPFVGAPGADEIYALGLRNPYRFSFDRGTGNIVIGDVGQSAREEVDYETLKGARGANFGWNAFEGTLRYPGGATPPARHDAPIFEYSHANGCSITGGYVARDRKVPALYGRYLYADFCRGQIRSLIPQLNGVRDDRPTGLPSQQGISSFGEDSRGHVWFTNLYSGDIYRIR